MKNVLIIGGGLTGSLIGFYLKRLAININIDLWECDEELGGRMKTLKGGNFCTGVDIGAQYITTNERNITAYNEIYSSLLKSCIIAPLVCNIVNMKELPQNAVNYVAPEGTGSIVDHFVSLSNFRSVNLSQSVKTLNILDEVVEVMSESGHKGLYDAVFITIPLPAVLALEGNFLDLVSTEERKKMQHVKFSCRDCLMLFYDKALPVNWAAKYMPQDDIFRYVAIQEYKTGKPGSHSSVIFHTSIQFGEKYRTTNDDIVKAILMKHAQELFAEWGDPVESLHYKWKYSQVLNSLKNTSPCMVISKNPLIVLAGDAFTTSNVDGCIGSSKVAAAFFTM